MGRETCASHTDNARLPDNVNDLFPAELLQRSLRIESNVLIQAIILHNDAHDHVARHYAPRFDRLDRTGHRCIDRRRNKAPALRNFLSCKHSVPLGNDRLCRSTDMLGQRIDQLASGKDVLNRFILRQFLSIVGMYTARKCQFCHTLLRPFLSFYPRFSVEFCENLSQ